MSEGFLPGDGVHNFLSAGKAGARGQMRWECLFLLMNLQRCTQLARGHAVVTQNSDNLQNIYCIITELSSDSSWRSIKGIIQQVSRPEEYPQFSRLIPTHVHQLTASLPIHIMPHRQMELPNIKWIISVMFLSTTNRVQYIYIYI